LGPTMGGGGIHYSYICDEKMTFKKGQGGHSPKSGALGPFFHP